MTDGGGCGCAAEPAGAAAGEIRAAAGDAEVTQRVGRVEALLEQVESLPDPARACALDLLSALLDLYGEGLGRVMRAVTVAHTPGQTALADQFASDDLVSHLLLLHGLHPWDVATRVHAGLERAGTALRGAAVESVEVDDAPGTAASVTVALSAGGGCGSTAETLRGVVEDVVRHAAPEVEHVDVRQAAKPQPLIPVESLTRRVNVWAGS
ncbi:MAG: hypothetical protein ACRDTQ_15880 [Micromonosporaceae bacterium]